MPKRNFEPIQSMRIARLGRAPRLLSRREPSVAVSLRQFSRESIRGDHSGAESTERQWAMWSALESRVVYMLF